MMKMDGQAYTEVVLKKCEQVKTLSQLLRSVALPTNRSLNVDQSVFIHIIHIRLLLSVVRTQLHKKLQYTIIKYTMWIVREC